jgi:hypothetical protein
MDDEITIRGWDMVFSLRHVVAHEVSSLIFSQGQSDLSVRVTTHLHPIRSQELWSYRSCLNVLAIFHGKVLRHGDNTVFELNHVANNRTLFALLQPKCTKS